MVFSCSRSNCIYAEVCFGFNESPLSESDRDYLNNKKRDLMTSLVQGITTCERLNFTELGYRLFKECRALAMEHEEVDIVTA